ncbi:hypothetical protein AKO1_007984 [Acrasis kona]|uniref:Uncharacterized protein n=1 Tax=Acrasis kona TaxID=1008807 RepID=A0AAW2YP74_9EUKA
MMNANPSNSMAFVAFANYNKGNSNNSLKKERENITHSQEIITYSNNVKHIKAQTKAIEKFELEQAQTKIANTKLNNFFGSINDFVLEHTPNETEDFNSKEMCHYQ